MGVFENTDGYIPMYWDYCLTPPAEYLKGHVEFDHAHEAIVSHWGADDLPGTLDIDSIKHTWARWVPVVGKDYDMQLMICSGPAPGAFAVTEVPYLPNKGTP